MAGNTSSDAMARFGYLFDGNAALPETDTGAAESAVASGGMVGSPFAQNNRLRLRDSERISRLQTGEEMLQPYLNRESGERISNNQIAAQAASDALRESGAMARLSAEGQQRLQLALINGDQQAAHDLLTESGANSRQAASLAASLQESTQRNQTSLLTSLLPYAYGGAGGGGGGTGAAGKAAILRYGTENGTSGPLGPTFFGSPGTGIAPVRNAEDSGAPFGGGAGAPLGGRAGGGATASGGSRLSGQLGPVLDRILAGYGLR